MLDRTEGWPAGLYLAALIARENPSEAVNITGADPYVADYLYRESMASQPEDVQRFLRRTAVVDQLSGPLCDALLEGSTGQARLRSLEATSLFVIPMDRQREWYRYHALYREFLLDELQRTEPEIIPKLHLRAADWYESNGSPQLAVDHLLHTDERDRCVQLVTTLVLPTYSAGQISTVQHWLTHAGGCQHRTSSSVGGLGRLGRRVDRSRGGRGAVGRDRRRPVRGNRRRWTARRPSDRRKPCCVPLCAPTGPP